MLGRAEAPNSGRAVTSESTIDDDAIALVRQLCARAGMIMEDASALAILSGSLNTEELSLVLRHTGADLTRALTLIEAARAMMDLTE